MSSNGNGLTNGKNGKKRRRRIIWGSIALVVLLGAGFGVKAALSPNHEIDPSKLASVERGDLARVVSPPARFNRSPRPKSNPRLAASLRKSTWTTAIA